MTPTRDGPLQSPRFLALYALAVAGGATAYLPFLTILLPLRISEIAENGAIEGVAYIAFGGAIAASIGNIAFGWISDRTGRRIPWILAGLVLSSSLLVLMLRPQSIASLIGLILVWQLALNMMLAPLSAMGGDFVPDLQKGTLGGLLSVAPALAALAGAFVTIDDLADAQGRLWLVAGIVCALVLPLCLFGNPRPMPALMEPLSPIPTVEQTRGGSAGALPRMWLARLLLQISEAALFAYLLLWFRDIDPTFGGNDAARLFAVVIALSVPASLMAGRWSDRVRKPFVPLLGALSFGMIGLVLLGFASDIQAAKAGYIVFGLSSGVFLALHSAQTLRVLPRPQTRGRDLGIFNLTNTIPSLVMPWLTLLLVPQVGFGGLAFVLAGLTAISFILILGIKRKRR
ncbi:MFS transporter [Erythrobacter litoralis]|uniref:MFS transporter n=1 Tax=Erythrobacter litoralis TaxID=39960 RepID=UPI002434A992|nr:MFS transporter [Erythrobacter litoralis]MDG6077791.1 MFS transporter [Erythrobacter litoralis]